MALTDMKGNDASGSTSLLPLFHRWITIYQHRISRYQFSTIAELITAQQIFFHFPKTKRARAQQSTALKYTAGRGRQYRVSIGGHRVFQANVCRNPDELTNPEGQDRHSTGADSNREGENTAVGFYFPSHLFKIFVQSPPEYISPSRPQSSGISFHFCSKSLEGDLHQSTNYSTPLSHLSPIFS